MVGHCVTCRNRFNNGTTIPVVSGIVGCRSSDEIGCANLVERCFIGGCEALTVSVRCTQIGDASPHRVLPVLVSVGEQVLVHYAHRFFNMCGSVGVESQG